MKKLYVLSGMIVLGAAAGINAMQQERPAIYKMIDPLVEYENDWAAVFAILDKMHGTINVNAYRTESGSYSLLYYAVSDGNFSATKILLEKYKANPNIKNYMGDTALMEACRNRDFAIIELLLRHGANPNQTNEDRRDSYDYANAKILEIFKRYGFNRYNI